MAVYEWPQELYRATTHSLFLQSRSQSAQSPWTARRSVYGPHVQLWVMKLGFNNLPHVLALQAAALLSRLNGTQGLLRIGSFYRREPQYNLEVAQTTQFFSDGTKFTDGTGFSSGLLPPTAFVALAASRGDNNLVIGGLPVSITRAVRRGDLIEVRPNGVAGLTSHFYEAVVDGSTDANGKTGVEVRPPFRGGLAVGDQVVLVNPMGLFRAVDESQNEMDITPAGQNVIFGHVGLTLVEALV